MQSYVTRVERLREIANRYRTSMKPAEQSMARIAELIVRKWDDAK
jgi:hypothetical protein